ncbi:MAG: hypothetical protein ACKOXB_09615 [Flavobacteriales bacterium]
MNIYGKHKGFDIDVPNAAQVLLSEDHFFSKESNFLSECLHFRLVLDELWKTGTSQQLSDEQNSFLNQRILHHRQNLTAADIQNYPRSLCYIINEIAHDYFTLFGSPFLHFIASGGIFKIIKGEVNRAYFQTAIQVGSWYLDLANDAVLPQNDKVKFCRLADSGFSVISTLQQYIEVKQKYFHCELYANHLFPAIAPYFPLVMKKADGQWTIDNFTFIADLMIESQGQFSHGFCKEMPPEDAQKILDKFQEKRDKNMFQPWTSPEKFPAEKLPETRQDLSQEELQQMKLATRYINFLLK